MIYSNVKSLPITENKENAWKNKIASSLNASNVIAGSGINVDYSPYGSSIKLDAGTGDLPLMWLGDFNTSQEYFPNMIVRVNVNETYRNQNNVVIPKGTTSTEGYPVIPISPGLFICTNYVPASACDQTWFNVDMASQYPSGIPMSIVNGTRFYQYNVYYPVFPEIPSNYTRSVVYGSYGLVANQTYWQAMPFGTTPMSACINGATKTFYVVGEESGSAFTSSYLPYAV